MSEADVDAYAKAFSSGLTVLKLSTIGTSTGLVLPKSLLNRLKVAIDTSSGVLLTPYDPMIQEQLEAGSKLLVEHRDVFKALVK